MGEKDFQSVVYRVGSVRHRQGVRVGGLIVLVLGIWAIQATAALPKIRVAADGLCLERPDGTPFLPFGVNYFWPGTGWAPKIWKRFDPVQVEQDFRRMKQLGVNCVRVFLSYGSFFREPDRLDAKGLRKFDRFLAIAEKYGIYVHPTGPDHWEGLPEWARGDRIASERVLRALEWFWRRFAARYRDRSVILAYDLLNEPSVPWSSPVIIRKWNQWLQRRYKTPAAVARAWGISTNQIRWGQIQPPDPGKAPRSMLKEFLRFREELAVEWTQRQAEAML